jgi:Helix-turn-helix domain
MQHTEVPDLLTTGQAAAVLHKSSRTVTRWAKSGELPTLGRIAVGRGVFVFDPEVVKQKAFDLGADRGPMLDLGFEEEKAS